MAAVRSKQAGSPDNFIEVGELDDNTDFSTALVGIDTVIHLAARAHLMKEEVADPLVKYRKVNVAATDYFYLKA